MNTNDIDLEIPGGLSYTVYFSLNKAIKNGGVFGGMRIIVKI